MMYSNLTTNRIGFLCTFFYFAPLTLSVDKIACYTRFTRHVVELVPLEHSSLRSPCSKPSRSTIDSCATRITIYYLIQFSSVPNKTWTNNMKRILAKLDVSSLAPFDFN
jgi:hypothetical protein